MIKTIEFSWNIAAIEHGQGVDRTNGKHQLEIFMLFSWRQWNLFYFNCFLSFDHSYDYRLVSCNSGKIEHT